MLLLDQPAKVSWAEGMLKQADGKLLPNSKTKEFETVRSAVRFIMEAMNEGSKIIAVIDTDGARLHLADIENIYAQIKQV
jgi:hypothetical protein